MKKNKILYVSLSVFALILLSLSIFYIRLEYLKRMEAERKSKIEASLNKLDVNPAISLGNSGSGNSTSSNNRKKTMFDIIKEERVMILTFSNVKQCDTLKYLKSECRDNFLYQLSKTSNSIETCKEIYNPTIRNDCFDEVNNNNLLCDNITNSYLKEKCSYELREKKKIETKDSLFSNAITSGNSDLCKKLPDYSSKETCVKSIILKKEDISLCYSVFSSKEEQTKCYNNISYDLNRTIISEAFQKKDLSICDRIKDENVKKQCKSMTF